MGNRVARWRTGRRILHALLAEHERGGYAISPVTWQRLRAEAASRALERPAIGRWNSERRSQAIAGKTR